MNEGWIAGPEAPKRANLPKGGGAKLRVYVRPVADTTAELPKSHPQIAVFGRSAVSLCEGAGGRSRRGGATS
jgi:hypothetical protein